MPAQSISTPRLDLAIISPESIRAETLGNDALSVFLNCVVSAEWPHADWEPHVLELLQGMFADHPEDIGWHRYITLRSPASSGPVLIGTCGAFRWSSNRSEAEFGYAILPAFRLHGYAMEAAQNMLAWIEAENVISTVVAHTYPELVGSIRILERCNFTLQGAGAEPRTLRYIKPLGSQRAVTLP